MKHVKLTLALFALAAAGKAQPVYTGQTTYDHSSVQAILSSGTYVGTNPGFVMGGYLPVTTSGATNFMLDKVDRQGNFSGSPGEFALQYQVSTGGINCSTALTQETNCYGVSVIESIFSPVLYAVAGAYDSGCVFATLNSSGTVVNKAFFQFPPSVTLITKPSLVVDGAGDYYITGSYVVSSSTRYMYALRLKFNGVLVWSKRYDLGSGTSLQPNAMIVAPSSYYANPAIAVAGIADYSTSLTAEGFLMLIDAGTGAINFFKTVGSGGTSKEEFYSIAAAVSVPGYIIGGSSDVSGTNQSWMLRIKSSGTMNWSELITTSNGNTSEEVVGVIERLSSTYSAYEYYGTARATIGGEYVFKLDNTGSPFSIGGNTNSEFLYDDGGTTSTPAAISFKDGTSPNIGIHVFGTTNSTPGDFFLTQACFNGASANCSTSNQAINSIGSVAAGPNTVNSPIVTTASGPGACSNVNVVSNNVTYSPVGLCNMNTIPTSPVIGINSRTMATGIKTNAGEAGAFSVYPNPVSNTAQINYTLHDGGAVKIDLYNSLGQHIKTLDKGYKAAGSNTVELDLGSLGVQSGVYLINVSTNSTTSQQKIIYNKD